MPHWSEHPSAYIDPETRGFEVKKLFSDYLGIPDGVGSDHPWRPPKCSEWNALEDELEDESGEFGYKKEGLSVLRKLYDEIYSFEFIKHRQEELKKRYRTI